MKKVARVGRSQYIVNAVKHFCLEIDGNYDFFIGSAAFSPRLIPLFPLDVVLNNGPGSLGIPGVGLKHLKNLPPISLVNSSSVGTSLYLVVPLPPSLTVTFSISLIVIET